MTEDRRRVQRTFVLVVARTMSRLVLGRISFVREASGDVQFIQTLKSGLAPISHSYRNPSPALLFLGSSLPKRITPRAIGSLLGAATIAAICVYPDYQENTDNADLLTYPSPGGSMRTQNSSLRTSRSRISLLTRPGPLLRASRAAVEERLGPRHRWPSSTSFGVRRPQILWHLFAVLLDPLRRPVLREAAPWTATRAWTTARTRVRNAAALGKRGVVLIIA